MADRLTVGVAARLSRYLQVLTQAKKMGKERISSQEISDYTNINATQIRRDLSGVRQVRQARRRLQHRLAARRDPQDPADAGTAQHRARSAPAASARRSRARPIFAEHGINIAAVFDTDPGEGRPARRQRRGHAVRVLPRSCARRTSSSACSRCPRRRAARGRRPVGAGVKIIFNYSEALLDVPSDVAVHTSNPAVELLYALYFHLTCT